MPMILVLGLKVGLWFCFFKSFSFEVISTPLYSYKSLSHYFSLLAEIYIQVLHFLFWWESGTNIFIT